MKLSPIQIKRFQKTVYDYFETQGRDLPWRKTTDPYHVLVSEIMLQQTQVDRVIPKYEVFIAQFPDFEALASGSVSKVLTAWSGLGYNRRALYLKKAAEAVMERFDGKLPNTLPELQSLPGIGAATAASISAFGFNRPTVFVETNVRSVFLFEFYPNQESIDDSKIMPLVEQTLDRENPRKWYNALMDYGTYIKKLVGNPNIRSKHYVKQSTFAGSTRQLRGMIIKKLLSGSAVPVEELRKLAPVETPYLDNVIGGLVKDGLAVVINDVLRIKE